MQIILENCGRRFNQEWIFRNLTHNFVAGDRTALLGPNGSGKSTLLTLLAGMLAPSEGTIQHGVDGVTLGEEAYKAISFTAPYIDLIDEFTLQELITFHFGFKKLATELSLDELPTVLGLERARHKAIKHFSSGMRQRTRLVLACCTQDPVLLLDEPTANLDTQGIDWYLQLIERFGKNKLIIVASNQEHEYGFCHNSINILDKKPSLSV